MGGMVVVIVVAFVVVIFFALLTARSGRRGDAAGRVAFTARKELFSAAERSFFGVLEQAVAGEYRLFGKVRLRDLIQPARGFSRSWQATLRNRVQQKHVDFVLCHPQSLAVVAVVELDDASHRQQERLERDGFVDAALASAGIPVLHFPVRNRYAVVELRTKISAALKRNLEAPEPPKASSLAPAAAAEPATVVSAPVAAASGGAVRTPAPAIQSTTPNCPSCGITMVKRKARSGVNAGTWFWACPEYPRCRKILPVERVSDAAAEPFTFS